MEEKILSFRRSLTARRPRRERRPKREIIGAALQKNRYRTADFMNSTTPIFPGITRVPRALGPFAVFLVLLVLSGCHKGNVAFTLDSTFSFNIADVNPDWPTDPELLHPNEQEVLEERGRPDYIHIFWSRRQDIVDAIEVERIWRSTGKKTKEMPQGWIYLDDKEEVVFPVNEDTPEVRPLSDKLVVICEMGDPKPSNIRNFPSSTGKRTETWHYVRRGAIFTFCDDILIKEDWTSVPPVKNYIGR